MKETINYINESNLSPIEKLMYIYDLSKETNSNKANYLFNNIAKELGFKSDIHKSTINGKKNITIIVLVNDPKYNINGLYYFNPRLDSKKGNNDKEYIYNYTNFAKTKKENDILNNKDKENEYFNSYSDKFIWQVKNQLDNNPNYLSEETTKTLNNISNFFDNKNIINNNNYDKELIISKLWEYNELMNNPISDENYLDILFNVRKIEYYNNPIKYPLNLTVFYKTYKNSNWIPKNDNSILFYDTLSDYINSIILDYNIKKDYYNSIQQINLTKTLKKYSNKKI